MAKDLAATAKAKNIKYFLVSWYSLMRRRPLYTTIPSRSARLTAAIKADRSSGVSGRWTLVSLSGLLVVLGLVVSSATS